MSELIRFEVVHGFLKKSQGKHYEYWYNLMNNTERAWLCKYYKCSTKHCITHNP